jgi:hypothetical protein
MFHNHKDAQALKFINSGANFEYRLMLILLQSISEICLFIQSWNIIMIDQCIQNY